jgi:hypothetical protein
MQRGRALLATAAVLVAARLLPASGDTTPPAPPADPCGNTTTIASCELPHVVCPIAITDIQGDAAPKYVANTDTTKAFPNNTSLDILAVDLRVTPDYFQTFLQIDHLNPTTSMQSYEATYRYVVTFKSGSKTVTVINEMKNLAPPASSAYPPGDNAGVYPSVAVGSTSWTGTTGALVSGTSPAPSWVVVTTPRSKLETQLGVPLDSTSVFTDITAKTFVELSNRETPADNTIATGDKAKAAAFDDSCFGPPPTAVNALNVPAVAYHHSAVLSAKLVDQDAKPLAGKTLTFTVNDGKPTTLTGTTDAAGTAKVTYGPTTVKAGSYPITVSFAGETNALKMSSATGTLKVSAQKTVFTAPKVTKPTATTRMVTTTLLDDLKKPVAGAKVDWYVNGKKSASSTTDKTGKVVFRAGKPGQTVQARYAGLTGKLLAAASTTAKL